MPAWAVVVITLGASLVAVLGTLAATRIQLRHSRREYEGAERARWREKGAEVVAPLRSLIDDAEPLHLGLAHETWEERWAGLWDRWALARHELTVFAAAHPSPDIGTTVSEITTAVPEALSDAGWFVGGFVGPRGRTNGFAEARSAAQASHQRATELAGKLLAEIRDGEAPTIPRKEMRPVLTLQRRGQDVLRVWSA